MDKSPATGNLLSVSEQVVGLILAGKQTPTAFSPEKFEGRYEKIMRDLKAGKTKEELMIIHGTSLIQSAQHAGQSLNGLGTELDWVDILDKSYRAEIVSQELDKAKRALANGEFDKAADIMRRSNATISTAQRMRSVPADEISNDYTPFLKSGSRAWDDHIIGLPTMGTVILGAKTFTGKTTVAIALMENFMNEYPDREILFVTLEDMSDGWKDRAKVILGDKSQEFWHRVKVMEFAANPDEIIQEASRYPKVGMIILDYIDYIAQEKSLTAYDDAYMKLQMGAKSLAVASEFRSMPIIVLAQFGKGSYKGGVPTLNNLMFTGDAGAYQICMLYNPNNDFYSDDPENGFELPVVQGKGYLIFWKVKNGFRNHTDAFPGAIQVDWSPKYGFNLSDENSKWFSLASETRRKVEKKRR